VSFFARQILGIPSSKIETKWVFNLVEVLIALSVAICKWTTWIELLLL
jgi:hypothetical protein